MSWAEFSVVYDELGVRRDLAWNKWLTRTVHSVWYRGCLFCNKREREAEHAHDCMFGYVMRKGAPDAEG